MNSITEYLGSNAWRLHTFGIAATLGFAYIINRARRGADAQLPHRQAAGWVLIYASLIAALALLIDTFRLFGLFGGVLSLAAGMMAAGILVILSGRG